MKRLFAITLLCAAVILPAPRGLALSIALTEPSIYFPQGHATNQADQILSVLRSDRFKFLGGLTSYWPPQFSTTLVYTGDAKGLKAFLSALKKISGLNVNLTYSRDLSKETGSALQAGSWWVIYSHTEPDAVTVRVNLADRQLDLGKAGLRPPK